LGPFIASATLAATECNSVSFERYGPLKFICPEDATHTGPHPGFFDIFQLVALEAFLWGAGTAIGELPPYFVARAARLAGQRVAELEEEADAIKQDTSFIGRAKQFALDRLGSMGFFGIMLFASIPNPLFDLAGLTSGHMLVPFWTFFGATLVGKAVVKVSLQAAFVLTVFSKDHLAVLVNFVDNLPFLKGKALEMFENVRKQYHRKAGEEIAAAPARRYGLSERFSTFLCFGLAYSFRDAAPCFCCGTCSLGA
jgi:membrane protein YqaA with SNARE-associated domain